MAFEIASSERFVSMREVIACIAFDPHCIDNGAILLENLVYELFLAFELFFREDYVAPRWESSLFPILQGSLNSSLIFSGAFCFLFDKLPESCLASSSVIGDRFLVLDGEKKSVVTVHGKKAEMERVVGLFSAVGYRNIGK